MPKSALVRLFVALVMAAVPVVGCTSSTRTSESTGAYVDDAAITAKVKEAILAEPGLHSLQIGVETYKGTVQLSGFVDTLQSKSRAGELTARVAGVRAVRNDLIVK